MAKRRPRERAALQPALPGFKAPGRRPRHARSYARVWSDPAVVRSRVVADHRFVEWRQAFASFLARLPPDRRAELRRRLYGRPGSRRYVLAA